MEVYGEPKTTVAYKVTRTLTGIECDVCEKIVSAKTERPNDYNRYFVVTTGHHDWGSESIESRETIDVCPECIGKYVADYLKDCSNTGYIEIETHVVWGSKEKREVLDRRPKDDEVVKVDHDGWY